MATFREADAEVYLLVDDLMHANHPHLAEAGVSVFCKFAYAPRDDSGTPTGPALRHHGYPALAVVKVNSHSDRVERKKDCTITIDGDQWPGHTDAQKRALIDHELEHLELVLEDEDDTATVKLDDCLRPKLKIRPHDFEIGHFDRVVERHGANAFEAREYLKLRAAMEARGFGPAGMTA